MKQLFEDIIKKELYKEKLVQGRYITLEKIEPVLQKLNTAGQLKCIGVSVLGKKIYSYEIGTGKIRILLWSQMHGNESTTTKAVLDFLNMLNTDKEYSNRILSKFSFCFIPMLNPDGATLHTRENANKVDLNRDFKDLSQPESKLLIDIFHSFKPHYCYNLHDQRSIFGVADTGKPATISFLAPAFNEERSMNDTRQKAVNIIAGINEVLKEFIPGQIGRFDDSFNINCAGDAFQYLGVPTMLFEAGHYPNDYNREETRKYVLISLITSFYLIERNLISENKTEKYIDIPQNKINFSDFSYKNVKIIQENNIKYVKFVAHYKEEIIDNTLHFNAYIGEIIFENSNVFGHYEYDANGDLYIDENGNLPTLNQKADFSLGDVKFLNGKKA